MYGQLVFPVILLMYVKVQVIKESIVCKERKVISYEDRPE